ncbi:hypothetical protein DN069_24540 [Streptacidiphilus pinicola]|uniref:Uncharacterized protein n=1 Tax=Streptacidiphilus pinicola TaxID=2219663 RepID=A0A2X0IHG7_9ACTN|nr:hypothetical protein [Streptacidiphilus pinicola]RAG83043.1 hypothetical protein DN069_24540 [Streptacidiphilus pinicola]
MTRSTTRLIIGGVLSATVVGATTLTLAGCASDRGSSVAIGDSAPARALTTPANSGVVFVPLDSPAPTPATGGSTTPSAPTTSGGSGGSGGSTGSGGGSGSVGGTTGGTAGGGGTPAGSTPPHNSSGGTGGKGGGTGTAGGGGSTGAASGGTGAPQTPAHLTVTALHTTDTAQRWCQRVTLTLVNSGDRAATSGTVTFATHVIGALGIDWWTYQTSQSLTGPVAGHATADESWTVCLDAWRVPLGMHLETRAATLG